MNLNEAMIEIVEEVLFATKTWKPFNSAHEGYAVIKEEFDELWIEIKAKPRDSEKMRKEAIQLGAMAIRFLMDVKE